MEITYSNAQDGSQYMDSPDTGAQVIKLNPIQFSNYPASNMHQRWIQVPGYRIVIKHKHGLPDLQPFAEHFLKHKINKSKSSIGYYKKYKLDDKG